MPLCDSCNGITPTRLATIETPGLQKMGYLHSPNFRALESSARSCPMCRLIFLAMGERKPSRPISEDNLRGPRTEIRLIGEPLPNAVSAGRPPRLSRMLCAGGSKMSGYLSLYTKEDDPAALSGDLVERGLDPNPATDRNLSLAFRWLNDCLTEHPACRETISRISVIDDFSNRPLPSRVIDVGPRDGPKTLYLYEVNGQRGLYATLSHCWGPSGLPETSQTKVNTLESRKLSVDQWHLPKTFRDAVVVTRQFGIRYLWIDALCILQDNARDWEQESSQMGEYYQNALLTIAAAGAEDSSAGCFIPRDVSPAQPVMLSFPTRNGTTGHLFASLSPDRNIEQSPLSQRGWVLQERILSRRILSYTRNRLHWECQTRTTSEDCQVMLQRNLRFGARDNGPTILGKNESQNIQLYNQWYMMVADYTTRKLTNDRDKLPAVSGLARELQKRTRGRYLAGLWMDRLHSGLLWRAGDTKLVSPPSGLRAPSWSWAALEGSISYETCIEDGDTVRTNAARVLEADVKAKGYDPNGEVQSGSVVLSGSIKAASVSMIMTTRDRVTHNPSISSSIVYLDEKAYEVLTDPGSDVRIGWMALDTDSPCGDIFCVRISDNKAAMDKGSGVLYDSYNVLGLVRCEGGYRRAGAGEVQEEGWFDGCVEERIGIL